MMPKTTNHSISPSPYNGVHVKLMPRSQLKHRKTKIRLPCQSKIHVELENKRFMQGQSSTRIGNQLNVVRNERSDLNDRSLNEGRTATNPDLSSSKPILYQTIVEKSNERRRSHTIITESNIPFGNTLFENRLSIVCVSILGLFVTAALIIPNVLLCLMLATIFQTPVNQTNFTQPVTYANYCGGVASYTQWQNYIYSSVTIFITISTTNCSFSSIPLYYMSISGHTVHTDFTGYNSIYSATSTSFTIYVQNIYGFSTAKMLNYSQTDQWNVTWVGLYY